MERIYRLPYISFGETEERLMEKYKTSFANSFARIRAYQKYFDSFGKYNVKGIPVYTPEMALIIKGEDLEVWNNETGKVEVLNTSEFLKAYSKGYNEGKKQFDEQYKISPDTLFGPNGVGYVKNLHDMYFHSRGKITGGWNWFKWSRPIVFNISQIKQYGFYVGLMQRVEELKKVYPELFKNFDNHTLMGCPVAVDSQGTNERPGIPPQRKHGPTFKPEAVEQIFEFLKDFFIPEQQGELKQVLETGGNAKDKLLFTSNGNRLADAFKQLYKTNFITGCQKKELEAWIAGNFKYFNLNRRIEKEYKLKTLNEIISTDKDKCKNPFLNIRLDRTTGLYKIEQV